MNDQEPSSEHMPKAVIIGASVGGLVAAVKLKESGWDVTILEKGPNIGGLYSMVETPFGKCELGMHVLYVTEPQNAILHKIFGKNAFIEKEGIETDLGGTFNNGILNADSIYPDVRRSIHRDQIEKQILQRSNAPEIDAETALTNRFGPLAASQIFKPILEKLWQQPVEKLSAGALHCYYDLRRIVLADKPQADMMKKDPSLDGVVANPDQRKPSGTIYSGRKGLFLRHVDHAHDIDPAERIKELGIHIQFGATITLTNEGLTHESKPLSREFDACIVASPIQNLKKDLLQDLDQMEMSIYYFKTTPINKKPHEPYYILCHDTKLQSSRLVNYPAYNFEKVPDFESIFAIEVLHQPGQAPDIKEIRKEFITLKPGANVLGEFQFEKRLRIASPTNQNTLKLNREIDQLKVRSGFSRIYFTGMRTDLGMFFSHHTIGAAYDAALDCSRT